MLEKYNEPVLLKKLCRIVTNLAVLHRIALSLQTNGKTKKTIITLRGFKKLAKLGILSPLATSV